MKQNFIISAFIIVIAIFPALVPAQIASGGGFSLEKSVLAGGGGESAGGGFAVAGTAGQNAAGTFTQNGSFFQIGGFWTAEQFAPTAALVSISGKITTLSGSGIRNVIVTLTDSEGGVRRVITGSFGNYRFTDVEVGRSYILTVKSRKYFFADPVRILTVNDELTNMDFTAED